MIGSDQNAIGTKYAFEYCLPIDDEYSVLFEVDGTDIFGMVTIL